MLPRPHRSTMTERGARAEVREGVERRSGRAPTVGHGPRGLSQADKYSGSGHSDPHPLAGLLDTGGLRGSADNWPSRDVLLRRVTDRSVDSGDVRRADGLDRVGTHGQSERTCCHIDSRTTTPSEQLIEIVHGVLGRLSCDHVTGQFGERPSDLSRHRCLHDLHYVGRILVVQAMCLASVESVVQPVCFGDQECRNSGHLHLDRSSICRIKRRNDHWGVINKHGFQTQDLASRSLPMGSEPSPASASARCRTLWDDQVDGHDFGFACNAGFNDPDSGFDMSTGLSLEGESGVLHG